MHSEMYDVAVVIPVYTEKLSRFELISLENNLAKLHDHRIVFVTPLSFNIQNVLQQISYDCTYSQEEFPTHFFTSTMSYNQLMLSNEFYRRFSAFEFILIAQLDTYVFRDELNSWCAKGYDYIGAPWFEEFEDSTDQSQILPNSGNGGLSLRKVSSFLKATEPKFRPFPTESWDSLWKKYRDMNIFAKAVRFQRIVHRYLKPSGWYSNVLKNPIMNEDEFFANVVPRLFKWFKVASGTEAVPFAFECQPARLYELNGNKLPFGCHAWWKYDLEFWKAYIKTKNGKNIS